MSYDPKQPRDEDGQWTAGGSGGKITRINVTKPRQDNKHPNQALARQIADQHAADAYETSITHMTPMREISMEEYNSRFAEAKRRELRELEANHKNGKYALISKEEAKKRIENSRPAPWTIEAMTHPEHGASYRAAWAPETDREVAARENKYNTMITRMNLQQTVKKAFISSGVPKKEASRASTRMVMTPTAIEKFMAKHNKR